MQGSSLSNTEKEHKCTRESKNCKSPIKRKKRKLQKSKEERNTKLLWPTFSPRFLADGFVNDQKQLAQGNYCVMVGHATEGRRNTRAKKVKKYMDGVIFFPVFLIPLHDCLYTLRISESLEIHSVLLPQLQWSGWRHNQFKFLVFLQIVLFHAYHTSHSCIV